MGDEIASEAPLQFDRAEVVEPSSTACANCQRGIVANYFTLNGKTICAPCRHGLEVYFRSPLGGRTWLRVLVRGGGAALLGTALYFAVLKITGYELGLIAIVVGLLVGRAVRGAAGSRGGWKLQATAMALTYASIVASYMPMIYTALKDEGAKHDTAKPGAVKPGTAAAPDEAADAPDEAAAPPKSKSPFADHHPVLALFALGGLLFAFAAVAPFLAGFQNFMGWIIIAIALYEAWKINRRAQLAFLGPYQLGSAEGAQSG